MSHIRGQCPAQQARIQPPAAPLLLPDPPTPWVPTSPYRHVPIPGSQGRVRRVPYDRGAPPQEVNYPRAYGGGMGYQGILQPQRLYENPRVEQALEQALEQPQQPAAVNLPEDFFTPPSAPMLLPDPPTPWEYKPLTRYKAVPGKTGRLQEWFRPGAFEEIDRNMDSPLRLGEALNMYEANIDMGPYFSAIHHRFEELPVGYRATGFENIAGRYDPENPFGPESWTSPSWPPPEEEATVGLIHSFIRPNTIPDEPPSDREFQGQVNAGNKIGYLCKKHGITTWEAFQERRKREEELLRQRKERQRQQQLLLQQQQQQQQDPQ